MATQLAVPMISESESITASNYGAQAEPKDNSYSTIGVYSVNVAGFAFPQAEQPEMNEDFGFGTHIREAAAILKDWLGSK